MRTLCVALLWTASVFVAYMCGRCGQRGVVTMTERRTDTVRVTRPETIYVRQLGSRQVRLPLADSVVHDGDSVDVEIPVEQAVSEGEGYRAYVSGYRPRLDSLVFVRTENIALPPARQKRWSVGVQAGYGLTPRGLQPYIGVGIAFRL